MIITLKGADFSASNIGTLSTWRITRSLGAGATYEGVTSVDKGAELNAVITIAEGYELGADGITVTMGNEVLSDVVTGGTSENSWFVIIPEVTGNVVIKVPTQAIIVEPVYYTITYQYVDTDGNVIKSETTEVVEDGTSKTFSTDSAAAIEGYAVQSVNPTSAVVNKDTIVVYTYAANEVPDEPDEPTYYTITYKYVDGSGNSIATQTTETVESGTQKTFSTSNAATVNGYTVSSVIPTSATITSNITVTYTYTANSTPDEPEIPEVDITGYTLQTLDNSKFINAAVSATGIEVDGSSTDRVSYGEILEAPLSGRIKVVCPDNYYVALRCGLTDASLTQNHYFYRSGDEIQLSAATNTEPPSPVKFALNFAKSIDGNMLPTCSETSSASYNLTSLNKSELAGKVQLYYKDEYSAEIDTSKYIMVNKS